MAAYDIFTMIDNGLMEPLTKVMDDTIRNLSSSLGTPLKLSCTIGRQYHLWAFFHALIELYSHNFQTLHRCCTHHKYRCL